MKLAATPDVLRIADCRQSAVASLLERYGLHLRVCADGQAIPGSYWGPPEAGLVGNEVFARPDTPMHSVLHEACHYLCMTPARRRQLHTDAGGDYEEENCVCYLQLVLAEQLGELGRDRMARDMDSWGYTFRLGSARAWFENDAHTARLQLISWGLLAQDGQPTWRLRGAGSTVNVCPA